MKHVALAGNPNSGKTTLFNELTGSSQHVGNWPGVTVEKKDGYIKGNKEFVVVDLPGIYSLSPYSAEEVVSRNYLIGDEADLIVNIVDATNMDRNLYLTTQLLETGLPMIVALNMYDLVKKRKTVIDVKKLEKQLGCPVVPISAATGEGMKDLVSRIKEITTAGTVPGYLAFPAELEKAVRETIALVPQDRLSRWNAIHLLSNDLEALPAKVASAATLKKAESLRTPLENAHDDDMESIIANERYTIIHDMTSSILKMEKRTESASSKIDRVVTNKWLALPIFFLIMWGVYYVSISTVGDWFIGWVESLFGWFGEVFEAGLGAIGASEWLIDLIVNGIIGGLGGIFTFVPQMMILFFFLSLLEDSGYMARIAFIMDRIFRRFGLSGKSFIPMLMGTGCSVPAIMASRTIERESDRNMTVILTPFVPCGAKLPVFALFISLFFADQAWMGPSIYLIAIAGVIVFGLILKRTKLFSGDPSPFVMELPDYKFPRLKSVAIHMWEKGKSFIQKAGTIIVLVAVIIWILQSFGPSGYLGPEDINESFLAMFGNAIRWIFIPLGFGDSWAPAVATLTGLAAKEVVVATFVTIGNATPILFSQVTAFAYIIFTIFAAPCGAAIGATRRELGSRKMLGFALLFQTGTAYVLATLTNLLGNLIFRGTAVVEKTPLDINVLNDVAPLAEETDGIIAGDIVMWFFLTLIVIAFAVIIWNKLRSKKTEAHA
ncbi:ferrous iron transport protein B [Parasphaerochaeta coccoides]|uniref:Ferrous iron transport protein B n=1 Tax=Parasphaerochaeta coccoides (strain ATCC BAA-1237 / DSM 17374 / SPN1) TaxID=760011 RepID=F4GIQ1_PARC1|nr:ferrous iron transport protein B [Parasphaerochaeta coccoides]AEC02185.1 ferrous iron transport protein B [Parasphaerochaeta coccoides DSM 17374]